MKSVVVRGLMGLAGIVLIAQFFRPQLTNPTTDPSLSIKSYPGVPPEVLSRIEHVCYDCHSNETNWRWYSYITPVNYFIWADVRDGRKHVNFSEWNDYSTGKLKSALDNIYDQVYNHEMPLPSYTWIHPDTKLTQADIKMICDWASGEEDRLDQVSDMQSEQQNQEGTTHDTAGKKK